MTQMTTMERYQFRRSLEEVQSYKGHATEMISVYVPQGKLISDVVGYLRDEYSQSSNIKSKSTMKHVTGAIDSIMGRLKNYKKVPDHGIVIFCGHVSKGAGQTDMRTFIIEPPLPIPTFIYRCDSGFFLEPLLYMLEDQDTYGLLVIDRSEATVGLLTGKSIKTQKYFESLVPSKHGRGGQSQHRFERLIEEAAHEFYVKVTNFLTATWVDNKDMRKILIGGPGPTKDYFLHRGYLHHELEKKVLDTFDVGYTNEAGLKELVENARLAIADLDITKEKALLQRFYNEIRKDNGLYAYGKKEVMDALNLGAVDTLIVSEGLKQYTVTQKCPKCRNEIKTELKTREAENRSCPQCQALMDVTESKDFVDELTRIAQDYGTDVELVSVESEEGDMLMKAFGGIAAILRYKKR